MQEITKQIKEKQYVSIPIEISKEEFEEAAQIFLEFLRQDEEEKEKFKFYVPYLDKDGNRLNYGRGDVANEGSRFRGFKRKEKKDGEKDNKQYFHYCWDVDEEIDKILETSSETSKKFIEIARKLYRVGQDKTAEILRELDKDYLGAYDMVFNSEGKASGTLRFLSYYTDKEGNFIAKRHYDKGFTTLALSESHPGLEVGVDDNNMEEVEHSSNKAIFFPSYMFSKFTKNEIKPTWHGVTQKKRDENEGISSRWAIVFFSEPIFIDESVSWEEVHTVKR